jgi:hypothetical protein
MTIIYAILAVAGLYPVIVGLWSNRATSLAHAMVWGVAAWLAWGWALWGADADELGMEPVRYVAVCLTAAAGVAVLGARRPYALAWNFVVLGLLAVMLLPLIEHYIIGTDPVDPLRISFVTATVMVGLLNYLPTRAAPAVLLLALALIGELLGLFAPAAFSERGEVQLFHLLVLLAPWAAWICWRRDYSTRAEFDQLWLAFRDRYGLFWSQRVREQFNHAAAHADWPVRLAWRGLHRVGPPRAIAPADQVAMIETLRKALQRFMQGEAQLPKDA